MNKHLKLKSIPLICLVMFLSSGCSRNAAPVEDVGKLIAEMQQRVVATTASESSDSLIQRYNQPKTIACLTGEFTVADNLPDSLRHGLFAEPASYPVTARFANASKSDDSEKDIRGLSLRVRDVPGDTIWGETGKQDFLMNSYPALFVATPEEFLGFMRARQVGDTKSLLKFFLNPFDPHLKSLATILKARGKHNSPLDLRYWSTVPSALDSNLQPDKPVPDTTVAVKYSVTPCSTYKTQDTVAAGQNQLRAALMAHLQQAPACFEFGVQLQTDPEQMPLEDASVIWNEDDSPFQTVATMMFENQAADDPSALQDCESSYFNPWQSLAAHTPLGRMNAVRKDVYATGQYHRANR